MLGSVAVALAILTQYAGVWGVPYFTFRTDRGSMCKNDFTGYTCSPMTLADVEYFLAMSIFPTTAQWSPGPTTPLTITRWRRSSRYRWTQPSKH